MIDTLRIALVCDWLTVMGGAERVLLQLHELFPEAPIYTSVYSESGCPLFAKADMRESFLGKLPGARRFHRLFLPLMPRAFESMDFADFDLVISSSHSAAKGIITQPRTLHVTYCHSPMRYVWDQSHSYQREYKNFSLLKPFYGPLLHKIRQWDRIASERPDVFLANSHYISKRITKYYHRDSTVVHPPVELHRFEPMELSEKGDHYLSVGRLIPYKRFDLALEACRKLGRSLHVVGEGPEFKRLKREYESDTIKFLGAINDTELEKEYRSARALFFPQVEDFGIVPLEAMASGTPVIAYGRGGALETIQENVSGVFFNEPTVESLVKAIHQFESRTWDPKTVHQSVQAFNPAHFKSSMRHALESAWTEHQAMLA